MVLPLLPALVGIAVTVALAVAAIVSRSLTRSAGAVAAAFGIVIVELAGFAYLALLVLFVVGSTLATRYGFEEKRSRNLHEGNEGQRGVSNVVAHATVPAAMVLVAAAAPSAFPQGVLAVLYTAALAFAAADTFASEFGVLAGHARSILTLRPVAPGTNGGVSAVGELFAFVGALTTGVVAVALYFAFGGSPPNPGLFLAAATAAGFLGCQIDSVLGETLENRGWLNKGATNLLAMLGSIGLAAAFLAIAGAML